MVDVAIDSARDHNNFGWDLLLQKVIGQVNAISQSVRGSYHHNATQVKLLANLSRAFLFLISAKLVSTSADVVNTT